MADKLSELLTRYRQLADDYSKLYESTSQKAQQRIQSQIPVLNSGTAAGTTGAAASDMEEKVRQLLQKRMASLMKVPDRVPIIDLSAYEDLMKEWRALEAVSDLKPVETTVSTPVPPVTKSKDDSAALSVHSVPEDETITEIVADNIVQTAVVAPAETNMKPKLSPSAPQIDKKPIPPKVTSAKPQLPVKPVGFSIPLAPSVINAVKVTDPGINKPATIISTKKTPPKTQQSFTTASTTKPIDGGKLAAAETAAQLDVEAKFENLAGSLESDNNDFKPVPQADPKKSIDQLVNRFELIKTNTAVEPSNAAPPPASNPFVDSAVFSMTDAAQEDPFADPVERDTPQSNLITLRRREYSRELLSERIADKSKPVIAVSSAPPAEDIFSDANQAPVNLQRAANELPKAAPFMVYEALYDYTALADDVSSQLSFKQGQLISVPTMEFYEQRKITQPSVPNPQKQAFGYLQYHASSLRARSSGVFPLNHVRLISDLSASLPNLFEAQYDYAPRQPDELDLTAGDFVVHLEQVDKEWSWCLSVNDGSIGLCPRSYLNEILPVDGESPIGSKRSSVDMSSVFEVDPFADVFAIKAFDDATEKQLTSLIQLRSKPAAATVSTVEAISLSASSSQSSLSVAARTSGGARQSSIQSSKLETSSSTGSLAAAPQVLERKTWVQHMDPEFVASLSEEERKRQEAIFELTFTEWTYVRNLQTVLQVFYEPIKSNRLLSDQDTYTIFCNIEHLLICNVKILSDFEQTQKRSEYFIERIGSVLTPYFTVVRSENSRRLLRLIENSADGQPGQPEDNIDDTLLGYYRYCANQFMASKLFQQRLKENPKFAEFVKRCTLDPRCRSLTLSSFLLEPMQRVTRYPLLINQILHYTDKNHPDQADLIQALNLAELLLKNINQAAKKVENSLKVSILAESIDLSPLSGSASGLDLAGMTKRQGRRELLFQSELKKAKSGRKLAAFLFNDLILLCEPTGSSKIKYTPYRQPLPLNETKIVDISAENRTWSRPELCFQFVQKEDVITVRAADKRTKDGWIKQLDSAQSQRVAVERSSTEAQSPSRRISELFPPETCIGTLNLLLLDCSAINFRDMSRKMGVFVDMQIDGQQKQKSRLFTLIPWDRDRSIARWNQSWMFTVYSLDSTLQVRLMKYDKYSRDEELGRADMSLDFLEYYGGKMTEVIYLKLKGQLSGNLSLQLNFRRL